ncbi:MAG TPA: efflux RND transporter periplasmic adaptor subunit [Paludibacteraceae bacterium]|nr:efflux RND transporter periplasmic adaptor subunit [Paludibacteraceae bacterium]
MKYIRFSNQYNSPFKGEGGKYIFLPLFLIPVMLVGCKANNANEENAPVQAKTSVSVTYPTDTVMLIDQIELNATATYLLKTDIKANTTGYITDVKIKPADWVKSGQNLFIIQTKEAKAIGNTINELDPSMNFSGHTSVASPTTGYVQMLNHQIGNFVQEGETLATIADGSSFGFLMIVPYEYNQLVNSNKNLTIELPDGRKLPGYVDKIMPTVDPVSQTEQVLVKLKSKVSIPENLIVSIKLIREQDQELSVPVEALLTDETQSIYWVMKLINDTTAVKTIVQKGIETDKWIQIEAGDLTKNDRIIVSGNYGLNDTALVKITKTR